MARYAPDQPGRVRLTKSDVHEHANRPAPDASCDGRRSSRGRGSSVPDGRSPQGMESARLRIEQCTRGPGVRYAILYLLEDQPAAVRPEPERNVKSPQDFPGPGCLQ